ncbi:predicted protein [Clavispora lusitaniae ATCC 42720]|uniref:Uncharacterized protein n=1 Tax=Clavispora lusitaniae (strain ATCC 42720) TaxID=306902 RepID=C4Y824_CLAL4|nr:uncharacterized protein CLUG_04352 [Clavispora lusitaniae ATCC 42720]EEQ40224.1 predicted protein [Clavispora lusitaniae ATCC 42720]
MLIREKQGIQGDTHWLGKRNGRVKKPTARTGKSGVFISSPEMRCAACMCESPHFARVSGEIALCPTKPGKKPFLVGLASAHVLSGPGTLWKFCSRLPGLSLVRFFRHGFCSDFSKVRQGGERHPYTTIPQDSHLPKISLGMWLCPASGLWTRHVGAVKEPSASDPPVADVVWFEGSSG